MSGIWPINKLWLQEHVTWRDLTYRTSTVLIWQPEGRNQAFSSISSQHCFPPVYQLLHCDGARAEQGGILQVWVLLQYPLLLGSDRQYFTFPTSILILSNSCIALMERNKFHVFDQHVCPIQAVSRYIPWTDGRSQLADPDSCKK